VTRSRSEIARQLLVFGVQNVGTMEQMVEAWEDVVDYTGIDVTVSATQTGDNQPTIHFGGLDRAIAVALLNIAGVLNMESPAFAEKVIKECLNTCRWTNR